MRPYATGRHAFACLPGLIAMAMSMPASAASYYCNLSQGISLGSYRPDNSTDEIGIRVRPPAEQPKFWFDEATGDYQADRDGALVESHKLPVPLQSAVTASLDVGLPADKGMSAQGLATLILADRSQCVDAPMGEAPDADANQSNNGGVE